MDYPFRNYWFWVVLVLVIGIFFFYITFNLPASPKLQRGEPVSNSGDSARLVVKFGENDTRTFEGLVVKDMTVLQALLSASRGGGFDVRYYLDKDGSVNLASIGSSFNGAKSWHFYLNSELITAGELDKVRINKGDLIEARYE